MILRVIKYFFSLSILVTNGICASFQLPQQNYFNQSTLNLSQSLNTNYSSSTFKNTKNNTDNNNILLSQGVHLKPKFNLASNKNIYDQNKNIYAFDNATFSLIYIPNGNYNKVKVIHNFDDIAKKSGSSSFYNNLDFKIAGNYLFFTIYNLNNVLAPIIYYFDLNQLNEPEIPFNFINLDNQFNLKSLIINTEFQVNKDTLYVEYNNYGDNNDWIHIGCINTSGLAKTENSKLNFFELNYEVPSNQKSNFQGGAHSGYDFVHIKTQTNNITNKSFLWIWDQYGLARTTISQNDLTSFAVINFHFNNPSGIPILLVDNASLNFTNFNEAFFVIGEVSGPSSSIICTAVCGVYGIYENVNQQLITEALAINNNFILGKFIGIYQNSFIFSEYTSSASLLVLTYSSSTKSWSTIYNVIAETQTINPLSPKYISSNNYGVISIFYSSSNLNKIGTIDLNNLQYLNNHTYIGVTFKCNVNSLIPLGEISSSNFSKDNYGNLWFNADFKIDGGKEFVFYYSANSWLGYFLTLKTNSQHATWIQNNEFTSDQNINMDIKLPSYIGVVNPKLTVNGRIIKESNMHWNINLNQDSTSNKNTEFKASLTLTMNQLGMKVNLSINYLLGIITCEPNITVVTKSSGSILKSYTGLLPNNNKKKSMTIPNVNDFYYSDTAVNILPNSDLNHLDLIKAKWFALNSDLQKQPNDLGNNIDLKNGVDLDGSQDKAYQGWYLIQITDQNDWIHNIYLQIYQTQTVKTFWQSNYGKIFAEEANAHHLNLKNLQTDDAKNLNLIINQANKEHWNIPYVPPNNGLNTKSTNQIIIICVTIIISLGVLIATFFVVPRIKIKYLAKKNNNQKKDK